MSILLFPVKEHFIESVTDTTSVGVVYFCKTIPHPKREMAATYLRLRVNNSLLMFNTEEVMNGLLSAQILYKLPAL